MHHQHTPKPRKIQARSLRAAIRRVHPSIVAFARTLGVPRNTVERVLLGLTTSHRIAEAIAVLYGKPPHVIWPGRYPEPGSHAPAA